MNVLILGEELAALCQSARALDRAFGRVRGRLVGQRLHEIAGSPSLGDLMRLPALECAFRRHGDTECVAVRVDPGLTIMVQPYVDAMSDPPLPQVQAVLVVGVEQAEPAKR